MRTRQPLLLHDCTHHMCLGHEASIAHMALNPSHPLGVTLDVKGQALLWHLSPCSPLSMIPFPEVQLLTSLKKQILDVTLVEYHDFVKTTWAKSCACSGAGAFLILDFAVAGRNTALSSKQTYITLMKQHCSDVKAQFLTEINWHTLLWYSPLLQLIQPSQIS